MRLPRVKLRIGTLMTVVLILALVAALFAQRMKNERRVAELRAELRSVRSLMPDQNSIASVCVNQTKIQAVGDRILIAAAAHVMDRRVHAKCAWSVEMFDGQTGSTVFSRQYDERFLRSQRGVQVQEAFADIIQPSLPAGDYRVLVSLSLIPPVTGMARLDNEAIARGSLVGSGSDRITLERDKPPE